ncbi:phage integrase family domain protein [Mycobacterium sp. MAC_080597_8934]|nr:phage integrase family domain protein [Mycobacterium sp. MAC_080597_8934]
MTGLGRAVEDRDPSGFAALRNAGIRLGWRSSWSRRSSANVWR